MEKGLDSDMKAVQSCRQ